MSDFAAEGARAGVHSIDHFALNVPSIEDAELFFDAFGLDVRSIDAQGEELELRAADGHRWARILKENHKSLAYLSFNCYEADLRRISDQAAAAGARFTAAHSRSEDTGFWFYDPDGNLVQVKIGPKTTPQSKSPCIYAGVGADERGAYTRSSTQRIRPRRLSHVLMFSPDVLRAVDFYGRALGLRLSDKSMDVIAFTHAPHGSDHHLVAFAKSSERGWHHSAWDVDNVNVVGEGAAQMAAAGFKKGWGTGRHVLGSNYFHYIEDPWGSFCEYSADIDFVSAGCEWPAADFPPEDSLYLWGPDVPGNFVQNTEAR
ncbi:MAG: VOC family protein [Collimonas sp.]